MNHVKLVSVSSLKLAVSFSGFTETMDDSLKLKRDWTGLHGCWAGMRFWLRVGQTISVM